MLGFPESFTDFHEEIDQSIGERGDAALESLREKGYTVVIGMERDDVAEINTIARQTHIQEYCPNDTADSRMRNLVSTERWLQKNDGRGLFKLLEVSGIDWHIAGYGWSGMSPNENLPNHPITTAYRLAERALGKRLSGDFVQTVVSATHHLFDSEHGIGLETWGSNPAAGLHGKLGFELVKRADQPELRPTLDPEAEDGMVLDTRLYMGYPSELLA